MSIRNKYTDLIDIPANGWTSENKSSIEINLKYQDGMIGLKRGMLIHVIWWFDRAPRNILKNPLVKGGKDVGVFAMRSPHRPNPIALSLCEIIAIEKNVIIVRGLEALDGSVVLDIKKAIN